MGKSKRVYVAYTGGTVGMKNTPQGYAPEPGYLAELMADMREFRDDITRFMSVPTPQSPEESAEFITLARLRMAVPQELQCTILESDRFVGCAGVHELTAPAPELGIWIARESQGAGRGTEAVKAIVHWTIGHRPRTTFLRYPVDRANRPSRRIAERLGGTIEATYRREWHEGHALEIVEYHIPSAPH